MPGLPEPDRKFDRPAALICGLLLLAGLGLGAAHRVPGFGVESDFTGAFASQARNLLHGRPYLYPFHPPGYSALLALGSILAGDLFLAGKLIGALSAALLAWLSYLTFRHLFDGRTALAATLLLSVALLPYSYLASSDVVGAAAIAGAFLLLVRPGPVSRRRAAALGAVCAAAYLIRSSGILALGGAVAFLLLFDSERPPVARRIRSCLMLGAVFLIAISPVYLYNLATLHRLTGPTAYAQIGPNLDPDTDPSRLTVNSAVTGSGAVLETLGRHPLGIAYRYARQVLMVYPERLAGGVLGFPVLVFAGAGLLVLTATLNRRRAGYLIANLLGYFLIGVMILQVRYYLYLFPFCFLLAGLGLFPARDPAPGPWPARLGWVALAVCTLWSGATVALHTRATLALDPVYLRPGAAALRAVAGPNDLVIAPKSSLAYLAGLRSFQPRAGSTLPETLRRARLRGARWLSFSRYELTRYPPFRQLAGDSIPPGLRLIYDDPVHQVRVFELLPEGK